jgi:hypothetical protein
MTKLSRANGTGRDLQDSLPQSKTTCLLKRERVNIEFRLAPSLLRIKVGLGVINRKIKPFTAYLETASLLSLTILPRPSKVSLFFCIFSNIDEHLHKLDGRNYSNIRASYAQRASSSNGLKF